MCFFKKYITKYIFILFEGSVFWNFLLLHVVSQFRIFSYSYLLLGLILNLNYGKVLNLSPTVMTQLMCNLSATLDVDHRKALNDFTSTMSLDEAIETQTQHEQVLKSVTTMQYLLDAQKIAVELLTNMCSDDGNVMFQFY